MAAFRPIRRFTGYLKGALYPDRKDASLKSGRVLVLPINRREAVKCARNQLIWMAQAESRRRPIRE